MGCHGEEKRYEEGIGPIEEKKYEKINFYTSSKMVCFLLIGSIQIVQVCEWLHQHDDPERKQ